MAVKKQESEISVIQVNQGRVDYCIVGKTPLILNRMPQKVKMELLLPRGRKTTAEKASSLKHNPFEEFRSSAHMSPDDAAPTRLMLPATAFKAALASVATDMPGAAKSQIGRLTYVNGSYVHVYGLPKLFMAVTRQKDINRTPDVRSRCIIPEWACYLSVTFIQPILRETTVSNLLAAAGIMRGVGDWRVEKGSGDFGQFELVSESDKRFSALLKVGREAQDAALASPEPYDSDTAEMLTWFDGEAARRGFKVVA